MTLSYRRQQLLFCDPAYASAHVAASRTFGSISVEAITYIE